MHYQTPLQIQLILSQIIRMSWLPIKTGYGSGAFSLGGHSKCSDFQGWFQFRECFDFSTYSKILTVSLGTALWHIAKFNTACVQL